MTAPEPWITISTCLKAVELALTGGKDMLPVTNPMTGKTSHDHPGWTRDWRSGQFKTWEEFWQAYAQAD